MATPDKCLIYIKIHEIRGCVSAAGAAVSSYEAPKIMIAPGPLPFAGALGLGYSGEGFGLALYPKPIDEEAQVGGPGLGVSFLRGCDSLPLKPFLQVTLPDPDVLPDSDIGYFVSSDQKIDLRLR